MYRKFGPPPPPDKKSNEAKTYPQLGTTDVALKLRHSVVTDSGAYGGARLPPTVMAFYIGRSRDPNIQTFGPIDPNDPRDQQQHSLLVSFLASIWRRRNLKRNEKTFTAPFLMQAVSKGKVVGYMLVYIESHPEKSEWSSSDKNTKVMERRAEPHSAWISRIIAGELMPKDCVELSNTTLSNDDMTKLDFTEQEQWSPLFKLNSIDAWKVACNGYTNRDLGKLSPDQAESSVIDHPDHPYCPRRVFTVANAIDKRIRENASSAVTITEVKGTDITVAEVISYHAVAEFLENVEQLVRDGPPKKTKSWWINPSDAHPTKFFRYLLPHIMPNFDPLAPAFTRLMAEKSVGQTEEEIKELYLANHLPEQSLSTGIEEFRKDTIQRVSEAGDNIMQLALVRKQARTNISAAWNREQAANYPIGAYGPAMRYGFEYTERKENMCPPCVLTHENVSVGLQNLQMLMVIFEQKFQISSLHIELLIHYLAVLDASRDDNDEHVNIFMSGPPGAGKSMIQKHCKDIMLDGSVDAVSRSTALSGTGDTHSFAFAKVRDEAVPEDFGVPNEVTHLYKILQIVKGKLEAPQGSIALAMWKQMTTTREQTTDSLNMKDGRKSERVRTVNFGTESISFNAPAALFPPATRDRVIMRQIFPADRADGRDNMSSRIRPKNYQDLQSLATLVKKHTRSQHFLSTSWNVQESCKIVDPIDLTILSTAINLLTRYLERLHFPGVRTSRGIGINNAMGRTLVQQNARCVVMGLGIGGPDPTLPITMDDALLLQPYGVIDLPTSVHLLELVNAFINPLEVDVIMALKKVVFRDIFFPRVRNGKMDDNVFEYRDRKYTISMHSDGYLCVNGIFTDPDFVAMAKETAESEAAGMKRGHPQQQQQQQQGGHEKDAKVMVSEQEKILLLVNMVHSSMPRDSGHIDNFAVMASFLKNRVKVRKPTPLDPKTKLPQIDPKTKKPVVITELRPIMYVSGANLKFNLAVLTHTTETIAYDALREIFKNMDVGSDELMRGRIEDDFFHFKMGSIGCDKSKPVPPKAVRMIDDDDDAGQANKEEEQKYSALDEALDGALPPAPPSAAAAAVAMSAPPPAAAAAAVDTNGVVKLPTLLETMGVKSMDELRYVNNPDYCPPETIRDMIKTGTITTAASRTFSKEKTIRGDTIDYESLVRERLKRLRSLDLDNKLGIPSDPLELEQYHAMPKVHRKLRSMIAKWHSDGDDAKLKFADVNFQPVFGPADTTEKRAKFAGVCETFRAALLKMIDGLVTYYIELSRHHGLRYTPTVATVEHWLYVFELKLKEEFTEVVGRGRSRQSTRDVISQSVYRLVLASLEQFKHRCDKKTALNVKEDDLKITKECKEGVKVAVTSYLNIVSKIKRLNIEFTTVGNATSASIPAARPQSDPEQLIKPPPRASPPPPPPPPPAPLQPVSPPAPRDDLVCEEIDPATGEPFRESVPPPPPPVSHMDSKHAATTAAVEATAAEIAQPSPANTLSASVSNDKGEEEEEETKAREKSYVEAVAARQLEKEKQEAAYQAAYHAPKPKRKRGKAAAAAESSGSMFFSDSRPELTDADSKSRSDQILRDHKSNRPAAAAAAAAAVADVAEDDESERKKKKKKRGKRRSQYVDGQARGEDDDSDAELSDDDDDDDDDDSENNDPSLVDDDAETDVSADLRHKKRLERKQERKRRKLEDNADKQLADRFKLQEQAGALRAYERAERKAREEQKEHLENLRITDPAAAQKFAELMAQAELDTIRRDRAEEEAHANAIRLTEEAHAAEKNLADIRRNRADALHEADLEERTRINEEREARERASRQKDKPAPAAKPAVILSEAARAAGVDESDAGYDFDEIDIAAAAEAAGGAADMEKEPEP